MVRFYADKIVNGKMNIEEVPKLWKKLTEEWLKENV